MDMGGFFGCPRHHGGVLGGPEGHGNLKSNQCHLHARSWALVLRGADAHGGRPIARRACARMPADRDRDLT